MGVLGFKSHHGNNFLNNSATHNRVTGRSLLAAVPGPATVCSSLASVNHVLIHGCGDIITTGLLIGQIWMREATKTKQPTMSLSTFDF